MKIPDKPPLQTIVLIFQTVRALIDKNNHYKKILNDAGFLNVVSNMILSFYAPSFEPSSFSKFGSLSSQTGNSSPQNFSPNDVIESNNTSTDNTNNSNNSNNTNNSNNSNNNTNNSNNNTNNTNNTSSENIGQIENNIKLIEDEEFRKKYKEEERVVLFNVIGDCISILLNESPENVGTFKLTKSLKIFRRTVFVKELRATTLRIVYEMVMNDKSTKSPTEFVSLFNFFLQNQKEDYEMGKEVLNILRRIFVKNEILKNAFCDNSGFLTLFSLITLMENYFKNPQHEQIGFQFLLEIFRTFTILVSNNPVNRKIFDEQITFGLASALRMINLPHSHISLLFDELFDLCVERISFNQNDLLNQQSIIKNPKLIIVLLDLAYYCAEQQKSYVFLRLLELSNCHRNKESMCKVHSIDFLLERYKNYILDPSFKNDFENLSQFVVPSSLLVNNLPTNTFHGDIQSISKSLVATSLNVLLASSQDDIFSLTPSPSTIHRASAPSNIENSNNSPPLTHVRVEKIEGFHTDNSNFEETLKNNLPQTSVENSTVQNVKNNDEQNLEDNNNNNSSGVEVGHLVIQLLIYLASHKLTISVTQKLLRFILDNSNTHPKLVSFSSFVFQKFNSFVFPTFISFIFLMCLLILFLFIG